MKLSVVILNYNVRYFLKQCLLSVERAIQNLDAEIIVIDNASTDGSCEMVKKDFPNITLLENKENVGFSRANNQAVKVAKGEFLCILNPDTAVEETVFSACFQFAENHSKMGALGIFYMDGTGNFLPESKRNIPTPKASLFKLAGIGTDYYASKVPETATGEVPVLAGAFMFLKKHIYEKVGGFDEDYFMYGEDIDLCYKITKAGYKNHYLGTAIVLHYKGESTQRDAQYYDRFYGAMQIFYKKHFNTNLLLDTSVNLGVAFAKRFRRASKGKKKITLQKPFAILLISNNEDFKLKVSEMNNRELKSTLIEEMPKSVSNAQIIFDASYLKYSEIFHLMKKFKNEGNHFRIIPPNCNFMLGSDASDEKGTVLPF